MTDTASTTPTFDGIHHIKLPVTDLERSLQWYSAVLGARRRTQLDHRRPDGTLFAVVLDVPGLGSGLELRLDPATAESLSGSNLLTLAIADKNALNTWLTHLERVGAHHSPPIVGLVGWVLTVSDPDGLRLQFYTGEAHGLDIDHVEFDSPWLGG